MRDRFLCALLAAALMAAVQLKGYGQGIRKGERLMPGGEPPVARAEAALGDEVPIIGQPSMRPAMQADQNRKMAPGDRISLRIEEDKLPAVMLILSPAGEVEVDPLPRAIKVSGMSPAAAAAEIKRLLEQDYYKKATVRLTVQAISERNSVRYIYLTGEIAKVGQLPILDGQPLTLSQAIAAAGGFKLYADDRRVKLSRRVGDKFEQTTYDVKAMINSGDYSNDPVLRANDSISVSRTWLIK